ncbi:C39 family peptidase [Fictibacillus gelatini]|uniref:C39 family peptidase n=1 Tax=Fictibacillus gelatini TaxID=225985 RepID=UPI0004226139|nr:C39 family peptidase [Fictibacillus gelatini]
MNKKVAGLSLTIFLSTTLIMSEPIYASSMNGDIKNTRIEKSTNTGATLYDPEYVRNEKYYKSLEEKKDRQIEKEETMFKSNFAASSNEHYTISVNPNMQKYWNFCGVASGRQALSFHKLKSKSSEPLPSQDYLGRSMGVFPGKGAATSTWIAHALNQYKYVYKFSSNPYVIGNIAQFDYPAVKLETRVKATLRSKKTAPILLLKTKYMPNYKRRDWRHYVTVSGYDKNADEFRLVDPNDHTDVIPKPVYWERIRTTKQGVKGIAQAVYKANKETSKNPVMVW